MTPAYPTNEEIANALDRIADLLAAQSADRYRVNAYRRAARVVFDMDVSVAQMAAINGEKKLAQLPAIGKSIAGAIQEYVHTARIGFLERLEGQISPEDLFRTLPGIGRELASRIHAELDIDSLEDLESAARDGRLGQVSGIGIRRAQAIRNSVGVLLDRSGRRRARRFRLLEKGETAPGESVPDAPPVASILEVDAEYRRKADAGQLKTITPRRFNPDKKAWLPIFHTEKDGWFVTALFSNTARAHQMNKIGDWVVIYFEKDGTEERYTVVTEHHGPLTGRRVVRGMEKECLAYYSRIQQFSVNTLHGAG